jgi:ribosome-associated protein
MPIEFELKGQEYIELNKLLKLLQLTETGSQANEAITGRQVTVNGTTETQKRKKIRGGDKIQFGKVTVTAKP